MPIKVTTTTDGENKRKQKPKSLQSKWKHKKNKCFLESVLRLLSLAVNHSTPHLCRMPSNTVLIAGPVWGRATQFLIWSYCAFLWILEWICAVTELKDLLKTGQNIWSSGCEKPGHQAREDQQWSLGAETWKRRAMQLPSLLSTQTAQATSSRPPGCGGGITEQRLLELAGGRPERRGRQREQRTLHMGREAAGAIAETLHSGDII